MCLNGEKGCGTKTVLCQLQSLSAPHRYSWRAQMKLYGQECILEIRLVAPKANMIPRDFF